MLTRQRTYTARCKSRSPFAAIVILAAGVLVASLAQSAYSAGFRLDHSLYMGSWSPFATSYELSTPICIWTDEQSVSYRVTAASAETAGLFTLSGGTGTALAYSVFWRDAYNPMAWNELQPDTASSNTYLYAVTEDCSGSTNTAMKIEVAKLDFDSVAAGIYSGTIVLTLSPQ